MSEPYRSESRGGIAEGLEQRGDLPGGPHANRGGKVEGESHPAAARGDSHSATGQPPGPVDRAGGPGNAGGDTGAEQLTGANHVAGANEAGGTEEAGGVENVSTAGNGAAVAVAVQDPLGHRVSLLRWAVLNILLPLATLAVGGLAIWLFGVVQPSQRPEEDASRVGRLRALEPVRVMPIRTLAETGESLRLRADGVVVPYREVQVATEVAGRIVEKTDACQAGEVVRRGDLLVKIDPTDYELEVERLTRQQEQAYEAIREVDQEMVNTRRLIEVAEEDVELQRREVRRLDSLPAGFSSEGELDRARRTLLQANQQLVTLRNQLDTLEQRRVSLQASERLAATQLRVAAVNLERTEIRAPMDGVVVREDAELNSFVGRGNPIVTIEDVTKVEVSTNLRMDQLYWVLNQSGQSFPADPDAGYRLPPTEATIEYELSGREGVVYRWRGRLQAYDGVGLDPQTRTVPVRVLVDSPQRFLDDQGRERRLAGPTALVRGMYVRVLLHLHPQDDLWVIPAAALKPGNRVWAFAPDPSVLDAEAPDGMGPETTGEPKPADVVGAPDVMADGADAPNEATADSETSPASTFDPARWVPGRIRVIRSVLPIDSLSSIGDEAEDQAASRRVADERFGSTDRAWWICEDASGELGDHAFLVVSPLGSVADTGGRARVERTPEIADQLDRLLAREMVRLSRRPAGSIRDDAVEPRPDEPATTGQPNTGPESELQGSERQGTQIPEGEGPGMPIPDEWSGLITGRDREASR